MLLFETAAFFREVPITEFLFGTVWTPLFFDKHFGVLPLVTGTLLASAIAMLVALPAGLLTADLPQRVRAVGRAPDRQAGARAAGRRAHGRLRLLRAALRHAAASGVLPGLAGFNALSPGIVMGIMILPLVSSLSEDALRQRAERPARGRLCARRHADAGGACASSSRRRSRASRRRAILAVSRAIGETMIVAIAAGQQPRLTLDPRVPVETMTAYIVQVSLGDTPAGTIEYRTIFAVGMLLFVSTFVLNLFSNWLRERFREEYA